MDDANVIKERREEWARRLESGDYTQGQGQLAQDLGAVTVHCCLGVACEQAHEAGIVTRSVGRDGIIYFGGHSDLVLPPEVVTYFGLDSVDPEGPRGIRFSTYNDEMSATFADIAQMVRELP